MRDDIVEAITPNVIGIHIDQRAPVQTFLSHLWSLKSKRMTPKGPDRLCLLKFGFGYSDASSLLLRESSDSTIF